jgi:hypothetical protein
VLVVIAVVADDIKVSVLKVVPAVKVVVVLKVMVKVRPLVGGMEMDE